MALCVLKCFVAKPRLSPISPKFDKNSLKYTKSNESANVSSTEMVLFYFNSKLTRHAFNSKVNDIITNTKYLLQSMHNDVVIKE